MNFLVLLVFAVVCAPLAAALPVDPVRPEYRLTPGENDASWQNLLDELKAKPPLRAEFEERRYFPFRKGFTRLQGEIRLDPNHGLSLHYIKPDGQLMVVDAKGGFVVTGQGRRRELPDVPRARAATSALLHVLRFDLTRLAGDFTIYAARDGSAWTFAFVPRPGALADVLHPITVTGENGFVRRIEMRKSASQRIEILIGETATGVTFSPEELARYFR